MKTNILLCSAMGALCLVAPAKAGLIYDNGGLPNAPGGVILTTSGRVQPSVIVADDFRLVGDGVLRSVTFWTVSPRDASPSLRELRYVIFDDNGGLPGSVLASGTAAITKIARTGLRFGSGDAEAEQKEVDFDLEAPLLLRGGQTYWLGLEGVVAVESFHHLLWESVGPGNSVWDSLNPADTFSWINDSNVDLAFALYGELLPSCDGPWKNHGQYVASMAAATEQLVGDGLITGAERDRIIQTAAKSDCGKK